MDVAEFQGIDWTPIFETAENIDLYSHEIIIACWAVLREQADAHGGLDSLQAFESAHQGDNLWFIEDGDGAAITALRPSEYWFERYGHRVIGD